MSDYSYFGAKQTIRCNCGTVFRGHNERYCDRCKSGANDPLAGIEKYKKRLRVKVRELCGETRLRRSSDASTN